MSAASRGVLREEFALQHRHARLHTNQDHPHVHLVIRKSRAEGRATEYSPRKADLRRWREGFALRLRRHGIEANATPAATSSNGCLSCRWPPGWLARQER